MRKKSFQAAGISAAELILTGAQTAQDTQQAPSAQEELDAQYAPYELYAHNTQGTQQAQRGKLPRINMAFSDRNLDYLRLMARLEGVSITQYVNSLIEADHTRRAGDVAAFQRLLAE